MLTVTTDIHVENDCQINCVTNGTSEANLVFKDEDDSLGILIGVDALRGLVTACSTALEELDALFARERGSISG